jgi:hypothetical protein
MDTGCKLCNEVQKEKDDLTRMCLDCRIALADSNVSKWMRILEELKQEQEKENGVQQT